MDATKFLAFLDDRVVKLQNYDPTVINTVEKKAYIDGATMVLKELKNQVKDGKFDKKELV